MGRGITVMMETSPCLYIAQVPIGIQEGFNSLLGVRLLCIMPVPVKQLAEVAAPITVGQ